MITLYTKENCGRCVQARSVLSLHQIPYVIKVLGKDYTREELLDVAPETRYLPVAVAEDGTVIGGLEEISKKYA